MYFLNGNVQAYGHMSRRVLKVSRGGKMRRLFSL
jgi:hypothetical protein